MPPKRKTRGEVQASQEPVSKRRRRGEKEEKETEEDVDYNKQSVFELKMLCKSRGLPNTGKKADLIARLEGKEPEEIKEEEKKEEKKKAPPAKKELPEEYDFAQKRFVITGEFARGKASIIGMLMAKGAVEASAVSGTTSLCVLGKPGYSDYGQKTGPGTKKHKDAKKKKLLCVDEAWVIKLCEGGEGGGDVETVMKEKWEKLVEAYRKAEEGKDAPKKDIQPPATIGEIEQCEARIGFKIPPQYRALLLVTNGGFSSDSSWGKRTSFPDVQHVRGGDDNTYFRRFYQALRMVTFGEYVHIAYSGLVFEWDTSFDGQCGNTIIANSLADYLDAWTQQIEETGEPKDFKRDWDSEEKIDESVTHKSFFTRFKSNYDKNFGRWPQYMS